MLYENPYRSATSVREKRHGTRSTTLQERLGNGMLSVARMHERSAMMSSVGGRYEAWHLQCKVVCIDASASEAVWAEKNAACVQCHITCHIIYAHVFKICMLLTDCCYKYWTLSRACFENRCKNATHGCFLKMTCFCETCLIFMRTELCFASTELKLDVCVLGFFWQMVLLLWFIDCYEKCVLFMQTRILSISTEP